MSTRPASDEFQQQQQRRFHRKMNGINCVCIANNSLSLSSCLSSDCKPVGDRLCCAVLWMLRQTRSLFFLLLSVHFSLLRVQDDSRWLGVVILCDQTYENSLCFLFFAVSRARAADPQINRFLMGHTRVRCDEKIEFFYFFALSSFSHTAFVQRERKWEITTHAAMKNWKKNCRKKSSQTKANLTRWGEQKKSQ